MANNPYVNKVVYGSNTLIDISDTTATADKILEGYTAYGADGSKLTGTATSGGSVRQDQGGFIVLPTSGAGAAEGLEYETGTWVCESNASPLITLAQAHTVAPAYYAINDATTSSLTNGVVCVSYYNWQQICGGSPSSVYGLVNVNWKSSGSTSTTYCIITTPYTSSSNTGTAHSRYWATETQIRAHHLNQGGSWVVGHTYNWIAVWAPSPT